MKIVINVDWGGFGLSDKAFERFLELKGIEFDIQDITHFGVQGKSYYRKGYLDQEEHYLAEHDLCSNRADPDLVQVVEEMGNESNGLSASLKVVEIPDDVDWYIHEYDGVESVHEKHRSWQ